MFEWGVPVCDVCVWADATRPKLYGLPFLFLLWHRRRSLFARRMFDRYTAGPGVSMKILKNHTTANLSSFTPPRVAPSGTR